MSGLLLLALGISLHLDRFDAIAVAVQVFVVRFKRAVWSQVILVLVRNSGKESLLRPLLALLQLDVFHESLHLDGHLAINVLFELFNILQFVLLIQFMFKLLGGLRVRLLEHSLAFLRRFLRRCLVRCI